MEENIVAPVEDPSSDGDMDIADDESLVSCDGDEDVYSEQPTKKKPRQVVEEGSQRRSKRLASKPGQRQRELDKLQGFGLVKGEKLWREMDKKLFLQACKEHGTKNIDGIIEKLSNKTAETVKALIQREKKNQNYTIETQFVEEDGNAIIIDDGENGRRFRNKKGDQIDLPSATPRGKIVEILRRRQRNAPIEMWIDVVEQRVGDRAKKTKAEGATHSADYSSILPTMLQWISEHETHPPVEECGGVDYAAIYQYLACLCQGEAPPDINLQSSRRVRGLLDSLTTVLQQHDLEKETDYLENYRGAQTKYRCEQDFDGEAPAAANILELSSVPGLNPLAFHPEMFTDKQIPQLDDLIRISSEEELERSERR